MAAVVLLLDRSATAGATTPANPRESWVFYFTYKKPVFSLKTGFFHAHLLQHLFNAEISLLDHLVFLQVRGTVMQDDLAGLQNIASTGN